MADKQISDLTSASGLTDGSLFVLEQGGAALKANWGMMKNYISPGVAAQYSTSATYDVGDYVIYNGNLYRCTTPITTAETWTAAHWTAAVLGDDVSDSKNALSYTNSNANDYDHGPFVMPYDKQVFLYYKTGNVSTYQEAYEDSPRAISKVPDACVVNSTLTIYNPNGYTIGIYRRYKANNEYVDYHTAVTTQLCFVVNGLDISIYDYYVIVIHYTSNAESNWTPVELDLMNRSVFIYSGDYRNNVDALSLAFSSNLITKDIIHTGKYYYGAATMGNNDKMAYTDLIPIKERRTYFFPYLTLGYSWYGSDGASVLGGAYSAVDTVSDRSPYITLTAPVGACFIGVSVRTGDIDKMVLSELPVPATTREKVSSLPVAGSQIVRESLNWVYNTTFNQNSGGSRLYGSGTQSPIYDGSKVTLSPAQFITSADQISMDKSRIVVEFSIPNGTGNFVVGDSLIYAKPSMGIADGSIGVHFRTSGDTQIRKGTGESGSYATVLRTIDISGLNIASGRKFCVIIEKNTINKYVISVFDSLCPSNVVEATIEATVNPENENLYDGQIRGWGGPFVFCHAGEVCIHSIKMFSTAPSYPKVAIWGDSYVENMGRNPNCSYAYLVRNALDGDAFLSGLGGATALQTSYRVAAEINCCSPQHIVFNVGVNDSFSVAAETFKTNLLKLIEMAKEKGANPVLITVPNVPGGNETVAAFCSAVNPWIRGLGYDYIDLAYALSTGDGTVGDTNKFVSDGIHPNLAGGQAIFNYIKAHLPQLIWK